MSFPAALSNAIDGVTEIVAAHLNNLEAKVGIDNSAVPASLDYLLKNANSIEPGHKHSKLWASDGSPEAVSVDATGKVGIGTTSPSDKLVVAGGNIELGYSGEAADRRLRIWGSGSSGTVSQYIQTVGSEGLWHSGYGSLIIESLSGIICKVWNGSTYEEKMKTAGTGNVGIGLTSPGKKLDVSGYIRGVGLFNTLNSAPADGDLAGGECALWFDKTNGAAKLMIKAKQADGTVKTASISLS